MEPPLEFDISEPEPEPIDPRFPAWPRKESLEALFRRCREQYPHAPGDLCYEWARWQLELSNMMYQSFAIPRAAMSQYESPILAGLRETGQAHLLVHHARIRTKLRETEEKLHQYRAYQAGYQFGVDWARGPDRTVLAALHLDKKILEKFEAGVRDAKRALIRMNDPGAIEIDEEASFLPPRDAIELEA